MVEIAKFKVFDAFNIKRRRRSPRKRFVRIAKIGRSEGEGDGEDHDDYVADEVTDEVADEVAKFYGLDRKYRRW